MGKVILFNAMSIDGYIFQEDGEIDGLWEDENYGYKNFYASIDTVILGRKTYDQILERSDAFPYRMKDVYVVSNLQEGNEEYARFIQPEQIRPLVNLLKYDQDKNIWIVGGAKLIQHFIQKQLIDEFQLAIQPTLLGAGISLFQPGDIGQDLDLYEVKPHPTGMLMVTYHKK